MTVGGDEGYANVAVELFAGTGSFSKAWRQLGGESFTVELNPNHNPDLVADVRKVSLDDIPERFRRPDVVWASPPCTSFSRASIGSHWEDGYPTSEGAELGIELLSHALRLINLLKPRVWFIENPHGMMNTLPIMDSLPKHGVWYCRYGDCEGEYCSCGSCRAKPTWIWTNLEGWNGKVCKNKNPLCRHERASRGSKTGTQGLSGNMERSVIEPKLMEELARLSMGDRSVQEVLF